MLYLGDEQSLKSSTSNVENIRDEYIYRPTVGTCGGLWSGGLNFGLPIDQRPDEMHSLNYTSAPVEQAFELFGRPKVVLYASSNAPVMAFVARLADVAPDGTSALVCSGVLNGSRRQSFSDPEPMEPDRVYELTIELDCTAWRFESGHRLRLSICSADFPNTWPTPFRGSNRIYRDRNRPSRLICSQLPVKDPVDQCRFPSPPTLFESPRLRPGQREWEIVHDVMGDRTGLRLNVAWPSSRASDSIEVTAGGEFAIWASNRDPSEVIATSRFPWSIVRGDGVTEVDVSSILRSTKDAFHLTVDLQVKVNSIVHFQRHWIRSFERELM